MAVSKGKCWGFQVGQTFRGERNLSRRAALSGRIDSRLRSGIGLNYPEVSGPSIALPHCVACSADSANYFPVSNEFGPARSAPVAVMSAYSASLMARNTVVVPCAATNHLKSNV